MLETYLHQYDLTSDFISKKYIYKEKILEYARLEVNPCYFLVMFS